MSPATIGPADFAPFRAEFVDCHCPTCNEVAYALSDVLDFRGRRHLAACEALLAELRAGTHGRVTVDEYVTALRAEKAAKLAALREAGAPASEIAAVERGYVRVDMAFMREGIGAGFGGTG
ncbi:hypothetical protein [Micromonospora sp. NPDC023956]|uniref:hypothetical protein n=1 Tax=Micromonospora sp. NPDC023956 TaxID=3155722 RepID=UPI0033CD0980